MLKIEGLEEYNRKRLKLYFSPIKTSIDIIFFSNLLHRIQSLTNKPQRPNLHIILKSKYVSEKLKRKLKTTELKTVQTIIILNFQYSKSGYVSCNFNLIHEVTILVLLKKITRTWNFRVITLVSFWFEW